MKIFSRRSLDGGTLPERKGGRKFFWDRFVVPGRLRNDKGFALILAVSMLAILSILGAMVLSSSNSDLGISSNFRTSQDAFYAADRAVEYAMGNSDILYNASSDPIDLNSGTMAGDLTVGRTKLWGSDNEVLNLGPGELPAKLQAKFGNEFGANYYVISVTGAKVDSGGKAVAKARIETQRVRLFPKEDDSIFRTTSGG